MDKLAIREPKFTRANTPDLDKVIEAEAVQWFSRFTEELAPPAEGMQPKFSPRDTILVALNMAARCVSYPMIAQVNHKGEFHSLEHLRIGVTLYASMFHEFLEQAVSQTMVAVNERERLKGIADAQRKGH